MEQTTFYRPTKATVQLDAIRQNVKNLQQYLGAETRVIAVVKADGYGHGEVEVAKAALEAGAIMAAVATPDEAVRLRKGGVKGDILVMGPAPASFAKFAAEEEITVTATGVDWLTDVLAGTPLSKSLKIHVKIDSGMGRIGIREEEELKTFYSLAKEAENIILDGIFTHFACADEENPTATEQQFNRFMELVDVLPEKPRLVHASNSAASLLYPTYALDAVRFGVGLYGIAPSDYVEQNLPFPLVRALTLKTKLAFVKKLPANSKISYGGTYETGGDEWIGTLPIGYADGLRRGLRGQEVLIGGERVPIVGTICMDQCMVRLPKEMPVGEEVVLIGQQGKEEITMEEWADRLQTIPYEIAVSMAKRVPREYIGKTE
ncbi:MAG TPA: alanine racemase [Sporosarcina sp.]|nr:alanine racemase [Sporosarcina sp.]